LEADRTRRHPESWPWWKIFDDETLDALEVKIDVSNQNVKAAAAAVDQARALVSQARSGFFPTIGLNAGRERGSTDGAPTLTTDTAGATASWSLDIWGQTRRTLESDIASAQASAPRLHSRASRHKATSRPTISNCARRTNCNGCSTTRSSRRKDR
jgi:outer membrane protein TolC